MIATIRCVSRTTGKTVVHLDDMTSARATLEELARAGITASLLDLSPRVGVVIPVGSPKRALLTAGIPVNALRICTSCQERSHSPAATRCPSCDAPVPYVRAPFNGPVTPDRSHIALIVGLLGPILLIIVLALTDGL